MAKIPVVAIIGRPNTGKSTLFNRLLSKRVAIESDVPGTTRDHVVSHVEGEKIDFLLLDTGGIGGGSADKEMEKNVEKQTLLAIEGADLIVFTINGREDLTASDHIVVDLLRKRRKKHVPILLVPTKCDNDEMKEQAELQYLELGIADAVQPVSAFHGMGMWELREEIDKRLLSQNFTKQKREETDESAPPRVAIIGKPNVGKSSFVNALMSDAQRKTSPRIVSDIPGTTRDTTDTVIKNEGRDYVFVDTAGLKRQTKIEEGIETFAMLRSIQAIEQAEVVLLLLDGTEEISKQDKRVANIAIEAGKGLIILLNKIDLLETERKKEKLVEIEVAFQFARFAPVIPCSAISRENLVKVFAVIDKVRRNRLRRIPTKELHRWLNDVVQGKPIGALHTSKHITQAEDPPPTFVLFVRNVKLVPAQHLRFLEKRMRDSFDFDGVPVRFVSKGPPPEKD